MKITIADFGRTKDGKQAHLYTICAENGMSIVLTDFGATLVSLIIPYKDGSKKDIVLGYDRLDDYEKPGFFGATVGRSANRIPGAQFTLDGVIYHLPVNENGNNLHSDLEKGFHKVLWETEIRGKENAVRFSYLSPDGENGFPGTLRISVTYQLLPDMGLQISYDGVSDKKTLINLTNHSFFNLGGHGAGSICDEKLTIQASCFTEIKSGALPTGRLLPVDGTPMDFRRPKRIGAEINNDWEQLQLVGGYDHNWILDKEFGKIEKIAEVLDERAGIVMEVYTDLPGVQFYTANSIRPQKGKNGVNYDKRCALCLETQYFPDSIHFQGIRQPVFEAGQLYHTTTIYKFLSI